MGHPQRKSGGIPGSTEEFELNTRKVTVLCFVVMNAADLLRVAVLARESAEMKMKSVISGQTLETCCRASIASSS
jgi:hypothetical protein